jgi:mono/diheme cytochrome c family protein
MKRTLLAALCVSATLTAWGATDEQSLITKGAYLARAGDCVACHTAKGGQAFTGGLSLGTPIGQVYSTNITPDVSTGIGSYSFDEFDRAVRRGIRKDGSTLYPAMPFPSYARVSDDDMQALYAYFMKGVPAVNQPNKAVDIPWPLSMRWPLASWRLIFAPGQTGPSPGGSTDPVVNRGAYLVEGLGHCGSCHTPRALTLQEKALTDSDGPVFLSGGAPLEGWIAKDLRGSPVTGLGLWREQDIVQFLKTGRNDRTAVFGGMSEVVDHSLQHLSDADLTAIARYLKTLTPGDGTKAVAAVDDGQSEQKLHNLQIDTLGGRVYADNCMACHRSGGQGYPQTFPALAKNAVLNDPAGDSVIRIVLLGATVPTTQTAATTYSMPAFGWRLSNEEVAAVTTFIRHAWGNSGKSVTADEVAEVRKTVASDEELVRGMTVHDGAVEARFSH